MWPSRVLTRREAVGAASYLRRRWVRVFCRVPPLPDAALLAGLPWRRARPLWRRARPPWRRARPLWRRAWPLWRRAWPPWRRARPERRSRHWWRELERRWDRWGLRREALALRV